MLGMRLGPADLNPYPVVDKKWIDKSSLQAYDDDFIIALNPFILWMFSYLCQGSQQDYAKTTG